MSVIPFARRQYSFSDVIRFLIVSLVIVAAVLLVNYLRNILLPFALACLIAYILEPLVGLNRRWIHTRTRAVPVLVTLVQITICLAALAAVFIPSVISEGRHLYDMIHLYQNSHTRIPHIPEEIHQFFRHYLNEEILTQYLGGGHIESVVVKGTSIISEALEILMHAVEWLLTFIYIIFIMIDYDKITRGFKRAIPYPYRRKTFSIFNDIKESMNHYFRGQAAIAACAAILYSIGFTIVGLPMAIIMGITVGILYMIPYFQYVTLLPVTILCLLNSMTGGTPFWSGIGQCLIVYAVTQCICDYILTPHIMGKALGLNPALILLSLSVWGTLLGLIGMIIALPLTALGISYYQRYILQAREPESATG